MRTTHKHILLFLLHAAFLPFCVLAQDAAPQTADSAAGESGTENIFTSKSDDDQREYFQLRTVRQQQIDSLKKLAAFWYADSAFHSRKLTGATRMDSTGSSNRAEKKNQRDPEVSFERRGWLNTNVFLVIMILALAAIIFFLLKNNIVGRRRAQSANEDQANASENIFDINYGDEIEKAIAGKNYRLATRLMFLRVLKRLSEKNIIQYRQERTNLDYLFQLQSSKYYKDFFRLTRNYEYVWWGQFDLSAELFQVIRTEFENFDNRLI